MIARVISIDLSIATEDLDLIIVNSLNFVENHFRDKSSLLMDVNIHVCCFIDPFTFEWLHAFWRVYQVPNLIFVYGYYRGFYGV